MAAAAVVSPSPVSGLMKPNAKLEMRKSFSVGPGLSGGASETLRTQNQIPDQCTSSPTQVLWLNLKDDGLPDGTPLDEKAYTPRASIAATPTGPDTSRRRTRRQSSLQSLFPVSRVDLPYLVSSHSSDIRRLSQLSGDLNLTSRRPDSDNDSVFASPRKAPGMRKGSILRRKSSFGGYTAPSSPLPTIEQKRSLKKTVSFGNLTSRLSDASDISSNIMTRDRRLSSIGSSVPDDLPDKSINVNSTFSILVYLSRSFLPVCLTDLGEQNQNKRMTRRVSMMTSLREELMQVDKVNVKKYAQKQDDIARTRKARRDPMHREKSEEIGQDRPSKELFANLKHRPSMPSLTQRSDSVGVWLRGSTFFLRREEVRDAAVPREDGCGSEEDEEESGEVTLEYSNLPYSQRINVNDESNILRLAAKGGRHGSLTQRTLISQFDVKANDTVPSPKNRNDQVLAPPGTVQLDAATREKLQKIYDQMVKPEAKVTALPGLLGRNRGSVTQDEIATETLGVFRKRIRRKKKPKNRFKRLASFVLVLLRLWVHHAGRVNELLELVDSVNMDGEEEKGDLLFDITEFKAEKEVHVPEEAKRILKKRPSERTEGEVHYVQIALRNYKSLAEYPVKMQKKLAAKAWFEGFGAKRVIVREGHIPMCFYFVMSGSAVVSVMDLEKGVAKTVLYYGRGDSFGELAIMNATRRQSTVISKEDIELLVISAEDFIDIFMNGGLTDPKDPFLCSLSYFDGWPLEKLGENPKKAQFCYYKRGAILVKDSKNNDRIVIVKSGSCRLLIKLKAVDPTKPIKVERKTRKEFREALLEDLKSEEYLSHEDRLELAIETELRELENQNQLMRFYALPEIFVEANNEYKELQKLHAEHAEHVGFSVADKLRQSAVLSRTDGPSRAGTSASMGDRQSGAGSAMGQNKLNSLIKKGPYMAKSKSEMSTGDVVKEEEEGADKQTLETSLNDFLRENVTSALEDGKEPAPPEPEPMYVNVQTLNKGMAFGISDIFFEDQPSMILVSNGAECITVNKKLFMDNASHAFTTRLREDIYPYPTEADMQHNLDLQVHWDHHKRSRVSDVIRDINFKRSKQHDARARFTPDLGY
ncbi:hypothetical protein RRG08_040480 [Elysia crispata]|uniref:Cyclic nucleotide-binding domain-containing protein n=1 Tax=Elysia crispata TaxID=231223 RepID=A0AAE0Z4S9_9GAST|nr:hypothetical protein RRG08_040480 [Elysia crispata]